MAVGMARRNPRHLGVRHRLVGSPVTDRRRAAISLFAVTSILILLTAAAFAYSTITVNRIRGDFCAWARVHRQTVLSEPATPVRVAVAADDARLMDQLGC
jgi:hypothetical protein